MKMAFSGFANRMKFGSQTLSPVQPTNLSDGISKENLTEEPISENSVGEKPQSLAAANEAGKGRFTNLTKSIGNTLSGFQEITAKANIPKVEGFLTRESAENQTEAVNSTETSSHVGKFTKFTKSIGGSLSGLRETAAQQTKVSEKNVNLSSENNTDKEAEGATSADIFTDEGRFAKVSKSLSGIGLLHSKVDPIYVKKASEGDKPELRQPTPRNSSWGKNLLDDGPRQETRFQRLKEVGSGSLEELKEEELISFDDGSNEAKANIAVGEEDKSNVLFDDENEMSFADVPLTEDEVNMSGIEGENEGKEG